MSSPSDVIVVGAGALGLACAAELALRGRRVVVLDPGDENASAVAAGMLAPAMESLLDDASLAHAARLRAARDLWPGFAGKTGVALYQEGAEWRGGAVDAVEARLRAMGFAAERRGDGVFTPDDWRLSPEAALAALAAVPGVTVAADTARTVEATAGGWTVVGDDGAWRAAHLIVATGAASALDGLPQSVAALIDGIQPIRGQLSEVSAATPAHTLRADGVYATPTEGGVRIGATMELGVRDLTPDPVLATQQTGRGLELLGGWGRVRRVRVGVRGASADGLPLAGSIGDGLHLALAPRRNGWLLAPMIARLVADGIEGRPPREEARAFDPLRFG